jgi:hypothetical protein
VAAILSGVVPLAALAPLAGTAGLLIVLTGGLMAVSFKTDDNPATR